MNRTHQRVLTLFLALAGTSMIVSDLLLSHARWSELGLGLLFLGMMSVNHQLSQQAPTPRQWRFGSPRAENNATLVNSTGLDMEPRSLIGL